MTGGLTAAGGFRIKSNSPSSVIDALKKIDGIKPLKVKYFADQDASHAATQKELRLALIVRDKTIFTPEVVEKIVFKGRLTIGWLAKVTVTYNEQQTEIYILEESIPLSNPVGDALKKINRNNPLKIKYVTNQDSSNSKTTAVLRVALTVRDKNVFTQPVVQNITFRGQLTTIGSAKIIAIYHNQKVDIYVQEAKENVIVALRQFEQKILKIKWVGEGTTDISIYDPFSTHNLRTALVAQDKTKTITTDISSQITFTGLLKKQQENGGV